MKKIWIIIILFISLFLLLGCGNQTTQEDIDTEEQIGPIIFSWEIIDIKNGNKVPVEIENLWKNDNKYSYILKVNFTDIFHTINFKFVTTFEIQNKKIAILDNGKRLFINNWLLSLMIRDNEMLLENTNKADLSCFGRERDDWISFPIWTWVKEKQWYEKNGEYYPTVNYSTINNITDFYVYKVNPYPFVMEPISNRENNCVIELNKYDTISKDDIPPFEFWSWFENALYLIPRDKYPESNCKWASRFIGSMIWADNFIVETKKLACHIFYLSDKNITPEIREISIQNYGIQHDIENSTITLDNWEESITIMDRNLWAEIAWTWEKSFWYYFQRWNNHGFQLNSEVKTGKDLVTRDIALQYWPNNWYDSDTQFVIMDNSEEVNRNLNLGNYFLAAVNDNLRWGSGDNERIWISWVYSLNEFRLDTGNPRTERQWPCPDWFHVPSLWEICKLMQIWTSIEFPWDESIQDSINRWWVRRNRIWRLFRDDLLWPMAGWIRFDGKATPHEQEFVWYYWMSSPWRFLHFYDNHIVETPKSYRAATFPIRCFKD